jgi:adenylate cyclase, class 2
MSSSNQEIEIKFCVQSLPGLLARLEALGAPVSVPRVFERNLRFDKQGGELSQAHQALRLRQDAAIRLTFKGPADISAGVQRRTEIELTVDNFDNAQAFLEALGYRVWMAYEKYRTTYTLGGTLVTLDELPYGSFVEIEGPTPESIAEVAGRLALDWEARINDSYVALFDRARQTLNLSFRDLSFDNFRAVPVRPEHLGVRFADRPASAHGS